MCFDVLSNLLDLIYLVSILPEPPNFEDEILLRRGECNSPTFQTPSQELRTILLNFIMLVSNWSSAGKKSYSVKFRLDNSDNVKIRMRN